MGGESMLQETYIPASGEQEVAEVYDFIAAHEAKRGQRPPAQYFLSGPEPGDQVQLPAEMYDLLVKVAAAMREGLAVTVVPRSQTMTTQQAADLLGISRPTLVKLLDEGRIPYQRINSHRHVLLRDVLAFREERRRAQYEALEAMSVDIDDEEDLESALESLKRIRRGGSERRRG